MKTIIRILLFVAFTWALLSLTSCSMVEGYENVIENAQLTQENLVEFQSDEEITNVNRIVWPVNNNILYLQHN